MSAGLTPTERQFYDEHGYLHVKGLLSREEAVSYRQELHELAERVGNTDATWSSVRAADPGRRMRITHCHDVQFYSATFGKLIMDEALFIPLYNLADIYGSARNLIWKKRPDEKILGLDMKIK